MRDEWLHDFQALHDVLRQLVERRVTHVLKGEDRVEEFEEFVLHKKLQVHYSLYI